MRRESEKNEERTHRQENERELFLEERKCEQRGANIKLARGGRDIDGRTAAVAVWF